MIGGIQPTNDPRSFVLLPYVRIIDANLNVSEGAPMKAPRCSIPLALLHDRWILAVGGMSGRTQPTTMVSGYDTQANIWFDCTALTTPRANCTAIVQEQRHIYLMPGANLGAVRASSLLIEYMDVGSVSDCNSHSLSQKSWISLEVNN